MDYNIDFHVHVLQCHYYNRGHLDKVDQLDYRKVTNEYNPRKLIVNYKNHETNKKNMVQNQPIGHFQVPKTLTFQMRPSASGLMITVKKEY